MYRSFGIFGLSAALFVAAASCSRMQSFELSGRIDGLQVGRYAPFRTCPAAGVELRTAFDVVVGEAGAFAYRGEQAHDGYYSMTYHPKSGRAADADRRGKSMIVTGGDRITLTGTAEAIYYCALGGGIYDDPALSELLYVADSLGRIRSGYSENARAAFARGDQAEGRRWNDLFNRFYADDPGAARKRALNENYRKGHPQGTLYLLVDRIPTVAYRPLAESRAFYEALSEELKSSYFGGVYADFLQRMESLAVGQPAPDFSLVTTRGETIAKADFAGGYVLFYHWGMCPGSIRIDGQVRDLYAAYKDRGLRMVGLTESVDMIRRVYEGLPTTRVRPGCVPRWPECWRTGGPRSRLRPTGRRTGGCWSGMRSRGGLPSCSSHPTGRSRPADIRRRFSRRRRFWRVFWAGRIPSDRPLPSSTVSPRRNVLRRGDAFFGECRLTAVS